MSEENVEIVRRIYAEFVDHPAAVLELYAPDFEMDASDTAPDIDVVRGIDEAEALLRAYFNNFQDLRLEIDEVLHDDDRLVVVAMHDIGRIRGSDAEVRNQRFHVWSFRDGKVVRLSAHLDRDQALRAAGLSQ
jgi:ketosteroid isomerase-like protein